VKSFPLHVPAPDPLPRANTPAGTGLWRHGESVAWVLAADAGAAVERSAALWSRAADWLFARFSDQPAVQEVAGGLPAAALAFEFHYRGGHWMTFDECRGLVDMALLEEGRAGAELDPLAALGVIQVLLFRSGRSERDALHQVMRLYCLLSGPEQGMILTALGRSGLDRGALFSSFLQRVALAASDHQVDLHISWLLGQSRIELPYDRSAAAAILHANADPDQQRRRLHALLRHYDRERESGNIRRISECARESGQILIFGRMSRAFHNQALLFADAVLLRPAPDWPWLGDELAAAAGADLRLAAEPLRLLLLEREEVPLIQLEGALERFEEAVLDDQRQVLAAALQAEREWVENHSDRFATAPAAVSAEPVVRLTEQRLRLGLRIRRRILAAPRRPAAQVVISQRPSPSGSHLLVKLNEFEAPYAGKPDNLDKLMRLAGERVYGSPDYRWLEVADHWVEAIPLFIKEETSVADGSDRGRTVVDLAALEQVFREEMADFWADNLRNVLDSEFLALARETLAGGEGGGEQAILESLRSGGADPADIAALGLLFGHAYRQQAAAIRRRVEAEQVEPFEALRSLLPRSAPLEEARRVHSLGVSWRESAAVALQEAGWEGDWSGELARLAEDALRPRRPLPALHVLTTQSAGMTEGYVRSWLEESMALYRAVAAHGLEEAVGGRIRFHARRVAALASKLIRELGRWLEVEEAQAEESLSLAEAIQLVARRHPEVEEGMAVLGTLLEFEEVDRVAERVDDPEPVLAILRRDERRLREAALDRVLAGAGESLLETVRRYSAEEGEVDEREALYRVVAADEFLRGDFDAHCRSAARREALQRLAEDHPDWHADDRRRSFLRRCRDLVKTTARKEILAERGLNPAALDPLNDCRASGGGKRYHLLYCPSRVDLGRRERESVESWSQWVGGADPAAAQVGRQVYGLINKDVQVFESLAEPEILKTGENASMASHYAYSNALAMMLAATRRGDFEQLADQMNRRRDRRIHPAGEGYGGYCVPKDGLFLEFVLSLRRPQKLAQLGLPEESHGAVVRLAHRLLDGRPRFASECDWEDWAGGQLRDCATSTVARQAFRHLFQVPRVVQAMERLGQPELRDPARVAGSLAARWGLHKMVSGGEQVNRFMPFFKVWLIHRALAEAGERHPGRSLPAERAVVVLTAEYKPDTQDARFSAGMRKFEILAGTGAHLLAALDGEGQELAVLLSAGYRALQCRRDGRPGDPWPGFDGGEEHWQRLFPAPPRPAEIRLVAPTGLSTQDLLTYTGDSPLSAIARQTWAELLAAGFGEREIEANLRSHGSRLEAWQQRSGLAPDARLDLAARLGGGLQVLALALLGPEQDYDAAVRGADLLDAGIPHRALLDLLADPGGLCERMLDGNPRSCLAIVDGASGARARAMNALDVMLWFAAGERNGRESVYRGIGVGEETVEGWRATMRRRRNRAGSLRQALQQVAGDCAREVYRQIVLDLRQTDAARSALDQAGTLARNGRLKERDRSYALALAAIAAGLPLQRLDFTAFLALGGVFLLVGADAEEIAACRAAVESGIAALGQGPPEAGDGWRTLLPATAALPGLAAPGAAARCEGSNKATEEDAAAALETRRQLAGRLARARGLNQRYQGYCSVCGAGGDFDASYRAAMDCLGPGSRLVAEADFGRFIGHVRNALLALAGELTAGEPRAAVVERVQRLCHGRRIDTDAWQEMAGGYEDIGDFGRLALSLGDCCRGLPGAEPAAGLERLARACELFQILLAVDCVQEAVTAASVETLWRTLADFFAKTLNDHHYEYRPWLYSRAGGFGDLAGESLYRLAVRRHAWLYRYLRWVAVTHTELRELPAEEQDCLLGNALDGRNVAAIGGEADGPAEQDWRAYGQLREIAFLRSDGFALPVVFPVFDPELIGDRQRVNHVIAAPVGRTHFCRMLREGPTLSRELQRDGRRGANLIIGRRVELAPPPGCETPAAWIASGHLYLDADTYRAALARHQPGRCAEEIHPKGIRVAARFTRPLQAALVYPFHGSPAYASGELERAGLPYTVQSLFHTWTTYDKTKYPDIFRASGVELPAQIDWHGDWTGRHEAAAVTGWIRDGAPQHGFPGLTQFARRHPAVIIKDAAESGGRSMKVFDLRDRLNRIDPAALDEAAAFAHRISLRQNVVIQEVILGSPECWASEEFMDDFVRRQITEGGVPVQRRRRPSTPVHGSFRVIVSTADPRRRDPAKWHVSHLITLNSRHIITNVGRGGTLEQLLPEFIRPEHREELLNRLLQAARQAAEALAAYHIRAGATYRRETGREVGEDATGVSYGEPRYLMLDFIAVPRFREPGDLVETRPRYDEHGNRTGTDYLLAGDGRSRHGTVTGWRVVLVEPNIGVGLWDRVALREEVHEGRRAGVAGREPDWHRVGAEARIVLRDLHGAGEEYLASWLVPAGSAAAARASMP